MTINVLVLLELVELMGTIVNGIMSSSMEGKWDELSWTEDPGTLLTTLKSEKAYNKMLAPGQLDHKTTNVEVAFYVESMSSFKAQTMDFELDMYLAMIWFDNRLQHKHEQPILISDLRIANLLWVPDIYFVNSKAASMQAVTTPNFMILVYPDGLVFKAVRVSLTLACPMDFERFPLDEQQCPIYMQSYAYVQNVLNLTWFVDPSKGFPINNNPNIRLNDMIISGRAHDDCTGDYPMLRGTGRWSCIVGYIRMKRLVMFHVFNTYIPTAMLVCISWLSFWLEARASPARISLTITTLLTLTTMSNGARQGLPQVSYIKAIDIWLSACTGFVFSVLLEYTLVSYFINKKSTHCKVHNRSDAQQAATHLRHLHQQRNGRPSSELMGTTSNSSANASSAASPGHNMPSRACALCIANNERTARKIDLNSRYLFPVGFAVFAGIYWIYYLDGYYRYPLVENAPLH